MWRAAVNDAAHMLRIKLLREEAEERMANLEMEMFSVTTTQQVSRQAAAMRQLKHALVRMLHGVTAMRVSIWRAAANEALYAYRMSSASSTWIQRPRLGFPSAPNPALLN